MSIVNSEDIQDILGLAIKNLLEPQLGDEKFQKKVKKLKHRTVVMEVIGLYAVTLEFNDGDIKIFYGEKKPYQLRISIDLDSFVKIAEGKLGLVGAYLKRKVKVKKIYRVFTILRFYVVFFPAIKAANAEPALEGVINVL